jgi:hypothetical protein
MRDGAVAQMNMPELLLADNQRAHRTTGAAVSAAAVTRVSDYSRIAVPVFRRFAR